MKSTNKTDTTMNSYHDHRKRGIRNELNHFTEHDTRLQAS